MRLSELFGERELIVGFDPADKWEAIRALVDHLVAAGRLDAERSDAILDAVLSRERSMSTGMESGVAIPHAAVDDLPGVVAGMGIVTRPEGLSFDSIDGQPARIVVLLVIPRQQKLLHIRTLADVARLLGQSGVREELLRAATPADAVAVLTRHEVRA